MKKKKIYFGISIICLGILLGVILGIRRFQELNQKYPNPIIKEYREGDIFYNDNLEVMVTGSLFMNPNEVCQIIPEYDLEMGEYKTLIVGVEVCNTGNIEQEFTPTNYMAQSQAWANGWDYELYTEINGTAEVVFLVSPGETVRILLPFNLYKSQFRKQSWENLLKRSFNVVISVYPIKEKILLNPKES